MQINEFLKNIEDPTSFLFIKDLLRRAFPDKTSDLEGKCNALRNRFPLEKDKEEIEKLLGRHSDEKVEEVFNNLSDAGKIEFNQIYYETIMKLL